ncbi:Acetylcholinesterase collagenic tail peptide, partial [Nibea albiflora]
MIHCSTNHIHDCGLSQLIGSSTHPSVPSASVQMCHIQSRSAARGCVAFPQFIEISRTQRASLADWALLDHDQEEKLLQADISTTGRELPHGTEEETALSRLLAQKCEVFIPPPLPPPLFPPVKRKAELMVDITERITGEKGEKGNKGVKGRRGASGEMGDSGQWGDPGLKGEEGNRGEPGGRGNMGLRGTHGQTGKQGHPGSAGLPGQTGEPGRPGQVYVLPGLQGDMGDPGSSAKCNCSQVQSPKQLWDNVQVIFIADGEKQMRRLRAENVMVLRTDRRALYIYSESQWINVL